MVCDNSAVLTNCLELGISHCPALWHWPAKALLVTDRARHSPIHSIGMNLMGLKTDKGMVIILRDACVRALSDPMCGE